MRVGLPNFPSTILCTKGNHPLSLFVDRHFQAIDFDQKNGTGVERKSKVKGLFHGTHDSLIHHFQCGGNDPRPDNCADRFCRIGNRLEDPQHCAIGRGISRQPHNDFRCDPQSALVSDEQTRQIVARCLFDGSAKLHNFAIR